MLSNYEEVILPIRVPVGVYCFNSTDGPECVTCRHLSIEDCNYGDSYIACRLGLGGLKYTNNGKILKAPGCLKLRRANDNKNPNSF